MCVCYKMHLAGAKREIILYMYVLKSGLGGHSQGEQAEQSHLPPRADKPQYKIKITVVEGIENQGFSTSKHSWLRA